MRQGIPNFGIHLSDSDIEEILVLMRRSLASSRWVLGEATSELEEAFARFSGASHVRAVANGGAALVALIRALGLREGSIVVCPTLTAPPTAHAILAAGMRVAFVDSSKEDLGIDPGDLCRVLNRHGDDVSAVIAVHVAGFVSSQLGEVGRQCDSRGIALIEDCAHAHGASFDGKAVGTTGIGASYSFFMTKPLTSGEGGMVTTERAALAEAISEIVNYGKTEGGAHVRAGFNYRISEFNAAVALWATRNGVRILGERRAIARRYDELLLTQPGVTVVEVPGCQPSYYKYVIILRGGQRDAIKACLQSTYGIEPVGGVYETLCHEEPYFRAMSDRVLGLGDAYPQAKEISRSHLCLPLYPGLEASVPEVVTRSLAAAISRYH